MLELIGLSFSVQEGSEKKHIVNNINLKVEDGEFLVVTGPNGSGKSTVAKLIAGINQPTSGDIMLDGESLLELSISERARAGVGFAFQQPIRFKGITVRDLLSIAAGRTLEIDEACEYLSEVGLCAMDYINREVNASLSGGELKRIEIALVIARTPRLCLFDEPEAGIDLWSFHNLIRVFAKMRARSRASMIVISHQERIIEIADRIVVFDAGEIVRCGQRYEVLPSILERDESCDFYKSS